MLESCVCNFCILMYNVPMWLINVSNATGELQGGQPESRRRLQFLGQSAAEDGHSCRRCPERGGWWHTFLFWELDKKSLKSCKHEVVYLGNLVPCNNTIMCKHNQLYNIVQSFQFMPVESKQNKHFFTFSYSEFLAPTKVDI